MDNLLRVVPPLYLICGVHECWKCNAEMPIAGMISRGVDDETESPFYEYVTEIPDFILDFIQARVPGYQLKFSKTVNSSYFANTCPKCGVLTGDRFLHEVYTPFFPMTEEDAALLTCEQIPLPEDKLPLRIKGTYGMGLSELILSNARR